MANKPTRNITLSPRRILVPGREDEVCGPLMIRHPELPGGSVELAPLKGVAIDGDVWAKLEKLPSIAARMATHELLVA